MRCRVCGEELRANNKSGIHTKCMTTQDRTDRLFARYKHTDHQGNAAEWAETARQLCGGEVVNDDKHLRTLGLSSLPSAAELKRRYRELMMLNHPDRGGTDEVAAAINTAYTELLKRIKD